MDLDDETVEALNRVQSSMGFRLWVRRALIVLACLTFFSLGASITAGIAIIRGNHDRLMACHRDNTLRASYTAQWTPLYAQAVKADDPNSRETVRLFKIGLDGFQQHPC